MYSCHRARVPRIVARCVPIRSINETVDVWSLKSTHGPNTGYLDVAILHAREQIARSGGGRVHRLQPLHWSPTPLPPAIDDIIAGASCTPLDLATEILASRSNY